MNSEALNIITDHARSGAELRGRFFDMHSELIVETGKKMAVCLAKGGKIMFCGNGGSAADAQHLAAEFVNRFLLERPPLPAIALTTDTSILTAIGNDYGYELVFKKQVQALGRPGDVLVGISTSGSSRNVVLALKEARNRGLTTVCMIGEGGEAASLSDYVINVPDRRTPLIQEIHISVGHLLCRLVDYFLFENVSEIQPLTDISS